VRSLAAWTRVQQCRDRRCLEPHREQSEEDWDRTIDINLKGVWLCLKYEIQQMLKQGGGGAIVTCLRRRLDWLAGQPRIALASMADGLTKSAARKRAKRHSGKRRCPAVIETPMGERLGRAGAKVRARPHHRPLERQESRRSRCVDVFGPCILHDRPILSSRWRTLGRAQSSN